MTRWGSVCVALVVAGAVFSAPAQGASVVYIKKNDVWMARADGSGKVRITRNGRRGTGNYYFSPSIADDGTVVALKGVFLHSFRPNGKRIVKPRQWAIDPSPALSTEPFNVDLSRNGRIVATENGIYSTYYDPSTSEDRPTLSAKFIDFFKFRGTPKEVGRTDGFSSYDLPAWIDNRRLLTTTYDIFGAQIVEARLGNMTSGTAFYRDPGRDPLTGTNSFILRDAEMTRKGDKFAVMRRPLQGASSDDPSVGTIQIYRTGNPPSASTPLCAIGPGRRISQSADPSWSPDGKSLLWWEVGRGIFSSRVTSASGCGLKPRLIIRGGLTPDLSKAKVPRRKRGR
jgi:hypothetical protein